MKNKLQIAISLAVVMTMLLTSFALADSLIGDALTTAPGTADNMSAVVAGGTTATYQFGALISNTGGPTDNVFPGTVDVDITRFGDWLDNPSGTPDTLSFTQYDQTKTGTVSIFVPCNSEGTVKVMSVVLAADASTNGKPLDSNKDTVTLMYNITAGSNHSSCPPPAPSDTTAPTASPTQSPLANGAGWNNTNVTVNWNWTDNAGGSGIDAANCTTSSVSSGEGTLTLNATCKDLAGNEGSEEYTVKVDKAAPVVTVSANPGKNANGWNNTDVTVSYTCDDGTGSGVDASASDLGADTLSASGTATGTCVDLAGNSASASYSALIDKATPVVTVSANPGKNANGWNNTNVTVSYTCDDGTGSGVDAVASDLGADTLTASGTASGTCVDLAGNSATNSYTASIDKVKPVITGSPSPLANANGWNNTNVTVSFSCTDEMGGSGIDVNTVAGTTVSAEGAGQFVTNTGICTDKAGNSADSATVSGINIDKTAPVLSLAFTPDSPDGSNGWWKTPGGVPFAWTCSDATSGIDSSFNDGCPSPLSAIVTAQGTTNFADQVKDLAGNLSVAVNRNLMLDNVAPSITITTPSDEASYLLNDAVAANYGCSDATSDLATCAGPVANGSNIDTAIPTGSKTFTVNASDNAGNTNSLTHDYTVAFKICALYDQTKSHKSGSTVPVKLQLCDANGVNYSSAAIVVKAVSVSKLDNTASGILDDSGAANSPEMNFRYDTTLGGSGGYIFNLSTKGLTSGTWKVTFTVNGASADAIYFVKFDVK